MLGTSCAASGRRAAVPGGAAQLARGRLHDYLDLGSLDAVFIPIFFMPGVIGLLFHEFAVIVGWRSSPRRSSR
jgi:hypothetical protein